MSLFVHTLSAKLLMLLLYLNLVSRRWYNPISQVKDPTQIPHIEQEAVAVEVLEVPHLDQDEEWADLVDVSIIYSVSQTQYKFVYYCSFIHYSCLFCLSTISCFTVYVKAHLLML